MCDRYSRLFGVSPRLFYLLWFCITPICLVFKSLVIMMLVENNLFVVRILISHFLCSSLSVCVLYSLFSSDVFGS